MTTTTTTIFSNSDTPDWKRHSCSAFLAGDEVVQVVPSFSTSQPLELLSVPRLGPLRAGVSTDMPLWLALLLEKRNLAKIQPPEWLSVDNLRAVLRWEQTDESFSRQLPFYWQPLARSSLGHNNNNTNSEAATILLQDIATVRTDKIRRNLHALSHQSLSQPRALPIVELQGIGALELASIRSFVSQSFEHHLRLSRPTVPSTTSARETRADAVQRTSTSTARGRTTTTGEDSDGSDDGDDEEQEAAPSHSRLRRFR